MAKRTDRSGRAHKRSQWQIQRYVNDQVPELDAAVLAALPTLATLEPELDWVSPLKRHRYKEYRDGAFLHAIGRDDLRQALTAWWPTRGPTWDALAVARGRDRAYLGAILIEAKSHAGELRGGTRAAGERRERIAAALAETRKWLGVEGDSTQRVWLDELYQSANRYAYLYWFNKVLDGERAWLANVYFIEDPDAPTSEAKWDRELAGAERRLGLDGVRVPNAGRVFLRARALDS